MTELSDLSLQQQKRFWLRRAEELIGRWELDVRQLSWLGYGSNAVFKVRAARGDYVLRLHPPGRMPDDALRSELSWLRHLRANTKLIAPLPVPTRDETTLLAQIVADRIAPPNAVTGCLFQYIAGKAKSAAQLTPKDMRQIGVFLGELHSAGQFHPPPGFSRPRLDWEGLFGVTSPYASEDIFGLISPEQSGVIEDAADRIMLAMRELDERADAFGLIHGDLLAKNILFSAGKPAALDFEYCGWGYFLYDLAPLLWQLKGDRARDYAALEEALWAGYSSLRSLTEADRLLLEDFIAARQLASCRWLLATAHHPELREAAPKLIAARIEALRGYLETGVLRRNSPTL